MKNKIRERKEGEEVGGSIVYTFKNGDYGPHKCDPP